MHSNYRHHYLLPTSTGSQAAQVAASSVAPASLHPSPPPKSRQQQHHHLQMANNFNGLPTAATNGKPQHQQLSATSNYSPMASKHPELQAADRLVNSQRLNGRYFSDHQQLHQQLLHRQQQQQVLTPTSGRNECGSQLGGRSEMANQRVRQHMQNHMSNDNNNHLLQQQYEEVYYNGEAALNNGPDNRDHYASQLRNSRMQHNFQHQTSPSRPFSSSSMQQHQQARGPTSGAGVRQPPQQQVERKPQRSQSPASSYSSASSPSSSNSQHFRKTNGTQPNAREDRSLHVNFNRANPAAGADDDEGDSRKKKYLTAKYGQQQMNLIKKRLKIEMWLCEQLKELASGSKSEAELEEIDIDLDQLLDMDDDDTRRRWLKKTLEPFEDIQADRIDKFIGDVLDQSKLL